MPGEAKNVSEIRAAAIVALLKQRWNFVETLHGQADAARFAFTRQRFAVELARSAASRFKLQTPSWMELEEYLSALHLADFALACACGDGAEVAWEFFVGNYRAYLRSCAAAILKRGGDAPEARELADSLFAELYGLADGRRGAGSLFRYFHGRSSLKTWLRAVLAQRHIDAIRASRKCESLDADERAGQLPDGHSRTGTDYRRKDAARAAGRSRRSLSREICRAVLQRVARCPAKTGPGRRSTDQTILRGRKNAGGGWSAGRGT